MDRPGLEAHTHILQQFGVDFGSHGATIDLALFCQLANMPVRCNGEIYQMFMKIGGECYVAIYVSPYGI
jgi:hypothetical protein